MGAHLAWWCFPDLAVVWNKIEVSKPLTESVVNPILEVVLRPLRIFQKVVETIELVLWIQYIQAVFEGIFDQAVLKPDGGVTKMAINLALQKIQLKIEDLRVLRENDMAAHIKGEAFMMVAATQSAAGG